MLSVVKLVIVLWFRVVGWCCVPFLCVMDEYRCVVLCCVVLCSDELCCGVLCSRVLSCGRVVVGLWLGCGCVCYIWVRCVVFCCVVLCCVVVCRVVLWLCCVLLCCGLLCCGPL